MRNFHEMEKFSISDFSICRKYVMKLLDKFIATDSVNNKSPSYHPPIPK